MALVERGQLRKIALAGITGVTGLIATGSAAGDVSSSIPDIQKVPECRGVQGSFTDIENKARKIWDQVDSIQELTRHPYRDTVDCYLNARELVKPHSTNGAATAFKFMGGLIVSSLSIIFVSETLRRKV